MVGTAAVLTYSVSAMVVVVSFKLAFRTGSRKAKEDGLSGCRVAERIVSQYDGRGGQGSSKR